VGNGSELRPPLTIVGFRGGIGGDGFLGVGIKGGGVGLFSVKGWGGTYFSANEKEKTGNFRALLCTLGVQKAQKSL
jgi:hypothetical protein